MTKMELFNVAIALPIPIATLFALYLYYFQLKMVLDELRHGTEKISFFWAFFVNVIILFYSASYNYHFYNLVFGN